MRALCCSTSGACIRRTRRGWSSYWPGMLRHVSEDPGLVSARILASPDGKSVAALVEMRTLEDRRRLEKLPEVRETLLNVQGAYNLIVTLYHEVGAYERAALDPDVG
jgi:hypothetical protein